MFVYKHTETTEYVMKWPKMRTFRVNIELIIGIKNAKFSGHYFYISTNVWGDFQIYIRVPLTSIEIIFTIYNFIYMILITFAIETNDFFRNG